MSDNWFPGVGLFNWFTEKFHFKEKPVMENICQCGHSQEKHDNGSGPCEADDKVSGMCICVKFVCGN